MFTSILLTVDQAEPAPWSRALLDALALARLPGGTPHAISVAPKHGTPLVSGFFPEDFAGKPLAEADAALAKPLAAEVPAGAEMTHQAAYGVVHECVLEAVNSTEADLVVMASHAPRGVIDFLVGSHADRIVRRPPVSVLVVRA